MKLTINISSIIAAALLLAILNVTQVRAATSITVLMNTSYDVKRTVNDQVYRLSVLQSYSGNTLYRVSRCLNADCSWGVDVKVDEPTGAVYETNGTRLAGLTVLVNRDGPERANAVLGLSASVNDDDFTAVGLVP
jgi:hypothetical protein